MTETPPPPHEPDPLEPDAAPADRGPAAIDPSTPVDPVDEAASSVIDGLDPDADAPVIDSDLLADRVRELTRATALLAEPVPPPDAAIIDTHIAAALDALTDATSEPTPVEHRPGPAVAPLATRSRRPNVGRWLAVAAAIAVVALAIPVLRSLSSSTTTSHDTAATATAASAADSAASSAPANPEQAPTSTTGFSANATTTTIPTLNTAGATTGGDLGRLDTPQELTAVVAGAVPPETRSSSTASSQSDGAAVTTTVAPSVQTLTCEASNRAGHPDLGALRFSATATYQSVPVEIAVYDVADSTAASGRVLVTKVDGCEVLLDRLLP